MVPDDEPRQPLHHEAPTGSGQEPLLQRVPHQWPGMFGVYKYSKQAVKVNLVPVVILIILSGLLGGASDVFSSRKDFVTPLVVVLLGLLINAALYITQIAGVRGQKISAVDAVSKAFTKWPRLVLLTILVTVSYAVSLLLLIVPFFFVLPRLSLATYFLVDQPMSVLAAYKASWHATKGYTLEPWSIYAVNVLIWLLVITIIGIPFAIYFYIMYSAAFAVLYELLRGRAETQTEPVSTPSTDADIE